MRARRGFSLLELLWAMIIVSLLTGIAIPKLTDTIRRARAAAAVADIRVIYDGVTNYNAEYNSYPATAGMGVVPRALASYLPNNFKFVKTDYSLQYNNWTIYTYVSRRPTMTNIIGITIRARDARLTRIVQQLLATTPQFGSGTTATFIIIGL
ncbi:MAG TPA: type II secretion system protein [Gemmatimonadaceae bacterium]|jgi:prepilin-type N-terminal cleavage/methylation domain-containing protein|nr:type II secretion system protein [Gemmatimonadaceae bacterium]